MGGGCWSSLRKHQPQDRTWNLLNHPQPQIIRVLSTQVTHRTKSRKMAAEAP